MDDMKPYLLWTCVHCRDAILVDQEYSGCPHCRFPRHHATHLPICEANDCEQYRCDDDGNVTCLACPRPYQLTSHLHRGEACPKGLFGAALGISQTDWNDGWRGPLLTYENLCSATLEFGRRLTAEGFTGIAGVPRSGMFAATLLSLFLGTRLLACTPTGLVDLGTGRRLRDREARRGTVLVVEDSSASGLSISEAQQWLRGYADVKYAAVFATQSAAERLDYYGQILPLPHWFEWNLLAGNPHLMEVTRAGFDHDGIFNRDFTVEEDDDGPRYLAAMAAMPCQTRISPCEIPTVVTARLEKYRETTLTWYAKHGMRVGNLVMGPWETQAERAHYCMGTWKAEMCKQHNVGLFVESCPHQATVMSRLRDEPVLCPALGRSLVRGT